MPQVRGDLHLQVELLDGGSPPAPGASQARGWIIFIWPPLFLLLYFGGLTNFPTKGTMVPFYLFLTCAGPSSLLYLLGHLFPKMRQMECLKCGWLDVYPFRHHPRSTLEEPVQHHFPKGKQQRKLRVPKDDANRFQGLQPP